MSSRDYESVKGFIEVLASRDDGSFVDELDAEVRRLVGLCNERGGMGSLTVTIKMRREEKHDTPIFMIEHGVSIKEPAKQRKSGFLFADDNGDLMRHQPKQGKLDGLDMSPAGRGNVSSFEDHKDGSKT